MSLVKLMKTENTKTQVSGKLSIGLFETQKARIPSKKNPKVRKTLNLNPNTPKPENPRNENGSPFRSSKFCQNKKKIISDKKNQGWLVLKLLVLNTCFKRVKPFVLNKMF